MGGHVADDMRIVTDARGAGVSRPTIGLGGGTGDEVGFKKSVQAASRVIGHFAKADTAGTGAAVLDLHRTGHEDFAFMAASAAASEGSFLLLQMISVLSTSTGPASGLRPGATMLRRSLANIRQADLYEPKASWRCSCSAEMPLEWVAIR